MVSIIYTGSNGTKIEHLIFSSYIRYQYGEDTIIVFDGYDGTPTIKDTIHICRRKEKFGKPEI